MGNEMEQKESWIFFFSNLTTRIIINLKKNINESNKLLNKFNDNNRYKYFVNDFKKNQIDYFD